jgi:hypothetical protein
MATANNYQKAGFFRWLDMASTLRSWDFSKGRFCFFLSSLSFQRRGSRRGKEKEKGNNRLFSVWSK